MGCDYVHNLVYFDCYFDLGYFLYFCMLGPFLVFIFAIFTCLGPFFLGVC